MLPRKPVVDGKMDIDFDRVLSTLLPAPERRKEEGRATTSG